MSRLNLTSSAASTRIGIAINQKYKEITSTIGLITSRRTEVNETATIGIRTIEFSDIEKIVSVIDKSSGTNVVLSEVPYDVLEARAPRSEPPREYAIYRIGPTSVTIYLDCIPTTAFVLYAEAHDRAGTLSGSQEPAFPESFHDILIEAVMYDELRKKEKLALAKESQAIFQTRLSDLRMWIAKSGYLDIYAQTLKSTTSSGGGGTASSALSDWLTTFGNHEIVSSGIGDNYFGVRNTLAGVSNSAYIYLGNDLSQARAEFLVTSSTYTPSGRYFADMLLMEGYGTGGVSINANAGNLRFLTSGGTLRATLFASGGLAIGSTTDPGLANLIVGTGGTGTTNQSISVDAGSGAASIGSYVQFLRNSLARAVVGVAGSTNGIISGAVSNDFCILNGGPILFSGDSGTTIHMKLSAAGLLTVNSLGTHVFSGTGAGANKLQVRSATAGVANFGELAVGNDTSATMAHLQAYSSTYTPTSYVLADGVTLGASGVGGLSIAVLHASGDLRFYVGGGTKRGTMFASGGFSWGDATDPGSTNMRAANNLSVLGLAGVGVVAGTVSSLKLHVYVGGTTPTISTASTQLVLQNNSATSGATGLTFISGATTGTANFRFGTSASQAIDTLVYDYSTRVFTFSNTVLVSNLGAGVLATGAVAGDLSSARSTTSGALFLGSDGASYLTRSAGSVTLQMKTGESFNIGGGSGTPVMVAAGGDVTIAQKLTVSTAGGNISWGTYTPTATNGTNVSAVTPSPCQWMRVGNTVTVSGNLSVTTSSSGNSNFLLTLPIASSLSNNYELAGTGVNNSFFGGAANFAIQADAASDKAQFTWQAASGSSVAPQFIFTYQVI